MPNAQVITAGLELAINKVLSLDEDSQARLQGLATKSCEVLLVELGIPLLFTFTETEVLVLAPSAEPDNKDIHSNTKVDNNLECKITLSVFAIPELQDMSNLTRLIREEKLDFEGNLTIAQQFADLFKQLDIDLEEELSKIVGDIAAHTLIEKGRTLHGVAKQQSKLAIDSIRDLMLDEKPIAVRAIMIENFNAQVNDLRSAADRIEARLKRLERSRVGPSGDLI